MHPPPSPSAALPAGVSDALFIDGIISEQINPTGLVKVGGGTVVLNNDNTYDGLTTVQAGILRITKNSALGTTNNGTVVNAGTVLEIDGGVAGITVGTETLTLNRRPRYAVQQHGCLGPQSQRQKQLGWQRYPRQHGNGCGQL